MSGHGGPLAAMALANARYWPTVLPRVRRGLRRWEGEAGRIPNDRLREIALAKLAEERFNTEVAATLATLAPRPQRRAAVDAIVPLQVMYDYLDGVSEEPSRNPLASGRQLFAAFIASLTLGEIGATDYYAHSVEGEDGGYLGSLVSACRRAFAILPAAAIVAPVAREAALRCGESQTRTHAVAPLGVGQLRDWATGQAEGAGLTWWEYTAGATASILSVHALIALAADSTATVDAAEELDRVYLYVAAISTLLDSIVDRQSDLEDGAHSFVGYYPDAAAREEGIAKVIARAESEAEGAPHGAPHGAHHRMTASGVAGYYLSAPAGAAPLVPAIRRRASGELGPPLVAALAVFRLWRLGKALAARRDPRA